MFFIFCKIILISYHTYLIRTVYKVNNKIHLMFIFCQEYSNSQVEMGFLIEFEKFMWCMKLEHGKIKKGEKCRLKLTS